MSMPKAWHWPLRLKRGIHWLMASPWCSMPITDG
jgi:hypothetical protein